MLFCEVGSDDVGLWALAAAPTTGEDDATF